MNNKLSITYLVLIIALFLFGCRGLVKKENKNNTSASSLSLYARNEKYAIDTKKSVVTWKGSNLLGSNRHIGYVYISKGELIIENGQLIGATAEIDMNTIEDENHGRDNGLVNHLKEPDFFDVKKFPFSRILLNKAKSINRENNKVAGNLIIKGITQPVTFPAKIEIKHGIVKLNGRLVIDRTKWNVRYKSGKFFDLLADQAISDSIEFHIKITAKKSEY
jgi:polyisoprenoid-binding protein YceI